MKVTWRSEAFNIFLIAAIFIASAIVYPSAPETVPIHWGLNGEPNGYGGRFEGLFLLPLMAVGIYLLLLFLPKIDPKGANYEKFGGVYRIIRTLLIVFMAGIHGIIIASIKGASINTGMVVLVMVGLMLAILGNYLGKIKQNWFAGIRTPWTLSSALSWTKTHQLGGRIFVIFGLLLALAGIIGQNWFFMLVFGLFIASIVYLVVYSYQVWKSDPNKTNGMTP